MPAGGRPTVRSRRLGTALRRYREAASLDQEFAAEKLGGSASKVSRIESGQVTAKPGDVHLLLSLYGVKDQAVVDYLVHLARNSNKRGWWMDETLPSDFAEYVSLEADASHIRAWQTSFIPGLLQTPDYVRTLAQQSSLNIYTPEAEAAFVKLKEERKKVINENGTHFSAVIWEPALTAPMPSATVHRGQLHHIATVAQQPNVTVQVLPLEEWKACHYSSHFVMLSFGPEPAPSAVVIESATGTMLQEDPEGVAKHAHIFEVLRSAAMTPDQSIKFIQDAADSISENKEED
ncbi:helix-turn-helix domain-containing protein [Streptomyces sp. NPDC001407]|uniref:helix-turn-helix domain-containing protein n=1 Tax=Streptomyces sp. NPDC001407 TaxID=3364573 RepID=UPI0036B9BFA3